MHRLFGQYMPAATLNGILDGTRMTEWQAFKSVVMPLAAVRNASRENLLALRNRLNRLSS